jgi:hypothetical protein
MYTLANKYSYLKPNQKGTPGYILVHSNKYIFISVHTAGKKAHFDNRMAAAGRSGIVNQRPE